MPMRNIILARGWCHTGMNSWDKPEIAWFPTGPDHENRRFECGPFRLFTDAKADMWVQMYEHVQVIRETMKNVKKIQKVWSKGLDNVGRDICFRSPTIAK